ncbi:prepilin-type N-terminal cleavage/methylation domain-containing protein [Vibrio crassostreae 9CS106]|nr:prepilin-type N-terminal cleavage/methylation domain-containing protein [Vibrio crassostreae 9CS106]OCH53243.1 prepilin-type N-terminal cleavage/methylation domain-containing protein [Vibrio sp. ZF57]OED83935.1 prepilin-type N-terminal cleavage/methylation domain-containing protein [Vibrio crassostreae ZF-91]PMK12421.1 prepilin-type N-terminal cleavage/methylation domain-containing protein [Vibrio sp. 10N.261.54.E10]
MMIRKNKCNSNNTRVKGMTLIELLIVVAIIGILGAIAYPSYTNHVVTGHRTSALADIARIQLELEAAYDSGYDWSGIVSGSDCLICDTEASRFVFSVTSSASAAYTITATPQSGVGQDKDNCFDGQNHKVLTLDSANVEYPEACWM